MCVCECERACVSVRVSVCVCMCVSVSRCVCVCLPRACQSWVVVVVAGEGCVVEGRWWCGARCAPRSASQAAAISRDRQVPEPRAQRTQPRPASRRAARTAILSPSSSIASRLFFFSSHFLFLLLGLRERSALTTTTTTTTTKPDDGIPVPLNLRPSETRWQLRLY